MNLSHPIIHKASWFLPALYSDKSVTPVQITNLLKVFVEVERTGRSNQFYEKFNVRLDLGQILCKQLLPLNLFTTRVNGQNVAQSHTSGSHVSLRSQRIPRHITLLQLTKVASMVGSDCRVLAGAVVKAR